MTEATIGAPKVPGTPPAKKPRGLIRWGMVVVVLGGGLAFAFLGAGPTARWAIEKYGSQALGAPLTLERARVNPLSFELALEGIVAKDKAGRDLFSAKEAVARLERGAALRGRFVIDELRLTSARLKSVREADGSLNVGGVGEEGAPMPGEPGGAPEAPPPGTAPDDPAWRKKIEEKAKQRDLVKDVEDLLKKLKERHDRRAEERRREAEARRARPDYGDPEARAAWVREAAPTLLIRRLIADGAVIEIEDRATGGPPAVISNATIEVKNVSSAPSLVPEPIEIHASFDAAPAVLDALFKETIPVVFGPKTTMSVKSSLELDGWTLDWRPLVKLAAIEARARDPRGTILGIDAAKFAAALTEVGTVALDDIRIFGAIYDPSVDLGQTLRNVVVEALKKKGEKVVAEQLEKGAARVAEKIDPKLKETIDTTGAGDLLEKGKSAVGDKLKGLLGGDDK